MRATAKPLVAIVGRPNVGKSTLFNRLVGRPAAIVSRVAGTTRDRVTTETEWASHPFILVDTGGLELFAEADLWPEIRSQIEMAIDEADVILMVVDAGVGVTASDRDVADSMRRSEKPVLLVANKADNELREAASAEFYELGMGDPVPVSAYHNVGIDELMDRVVVQFPSSPQPATADADLNLAIVGRTNVGKSMLLNAITGQDRSIVSEVPGTTRDALDTLMTYDGDSVLLIDTAGIRRRGRIEPGIERYSVLRAIRAIDRADVVLLLMDASELASSQDAHVAGYALDAYKGIVLAVNKWDLARDLGLTKETATTRIRERFRFASYAPICFVSALRRSGIEDLLHTAQEVHGEWTKGLPRYDLRRTVMNAVAEHPPARSSKGSLRIYSVAQDGAGPPSFTFYVNRSDVVHFSYQRYLENTLRQAYQFKGSPLKIRFKARSRK